MFISVDLPEPEEPMIETSSPAPMSRSMPFNTCRRFAPTVYVLWMSRSRIIADRLPRLDASGRNARLRMEGYTQAVGERLIHRAPGARPAVRRWVTLIDHCVVGSLGGAVPLP